MKPSFPLIYMLPSILTYVNSKSLIITQGHQKNIKNKSETTYDSTPSHMAVVIYYYMGHKYKATSSTWYLNGFPNGTVVTMGQQYIVGLEKI